MRHLRKVAKLGRNSGHRKALLVNLACSVILHEQVKTTVTRAKEVRRLIDRLITFGKKGTEAHRRLAVAKLFSDLAKRYETRNGGYTRIIRLGTRVGDAAPVCILQLVEAAAANQEVKKDEAAS